jgi:hypothetical protein
MTGDNTDRELLSSSEIEWLKQELTAIQDVIGAIRACERSCATIKPLWKRKAAIIEKLQQENRRVLECRAKLDEVQLRWRDVRARMKSERKVKEVELVT